MSNTLTAARYYVARYSSSIYGDTSVIVEHIDATLRAQSSGFDRLWEMLPSRQGDVHELAGSLRRPFEQVILRPREDPRSPAFLLPQQFSELIRNFTFSEAQSCYKSQQERRALEERAG